MEKIIYAESWQERLAEFGLEKFDNFFSFTGGEIVNKNNKRDVTIMAFEQGTDSKTFFMKRFFKPHFKDMFFALRSFGSFCSQAELEWKNANFLLNNGVETYRPVCYGVRSALGIERQSFIVTEEIKGQCLTDFVKENWSQLAEFEKKKILVSLGKLFRKIHDLGISLPDLYVWHIFVMSETGSDKLDFAVIDLHRMTANTRNRNEQLKNLGRFHHSMINKYFTDHDRDLLINAYAGDNRDQSDLAEKIKKYSKKVSAKRRPKPY